MMINPVLGREIKERMRSRRAVVMLVAFLTLLAIILYLTYRGGLMMMDDRFSPFAGNTASLGRVMFEWLLFFLVMFVSFIAPGVAAGSIVGERERQTLHPLQVTLLTPRSIVLGKLGASMAYVTLLVVATAPLFAVPLVLGGVTPGQVLRGFLVILALEVTLASMAIYVSAVAKRVQFAIVAAYGLALLLLVGTVVLFGAEMLWRSQQDPHTDVSQDALSVYLNPVVAMADAVTDNASSSFPTPLSALGSYTRQRQLASLEVDADVERVRGHVRRVRLVEGQLPERVFVGPRGDVIAEVQPGFQEFADHQRRGTELPALRMWMIHVAFLLLVSAAALFLAAVRLRTPVVKIVSVRRKK